MQRQTQDLADRQEALPQEGQGVSGWAGLKGRLRSLCYLTGVQILRLLIFLRLKLRGVLRRVKVLGHDLADWIYRLFRRVAVRHAQAGESITERLGQLGEEFAQASQQGVKGQFVWLSTQIWELARRSGKQLLRNRNYWMPAAAAAFFALVVAVGTHLNFALQVEYNGEVIGYIADESVFERAQTQMQGRIVYEEYIQPEDTIPRFSIQVVSDGQMTSVNELTNELIRASGNELGEAYGLYADEDFLGATEDITEIQQLLASILDEYRSPEDGEDTEISFVQDVEIREGLYPVSSIVGIEGIEEKATSEVSQEQIYVVQQGDVPITIAQKHNVSYSELKALNPEVETTLLIGQEVVIARAVPLLGVQVTKTETVVQDVAFEVQQQQDSSQYQGYVKVQQQGQMGSEEVISRVTYVDGVETSRQVVDTRIISEPVDEIVIVGGKMPLKQISSATVSTSMIWPVDGGGYVSCGLNGYWGHTGMDIAGIPAGTGVRAAAAGTVVLVRRQTTGYGFHVMIDHGGGVQTLYAHNSQIYVEQGQWVEQGELIAAVGRTGRATGNHLHFEVRVNGVYKNPADYIGTR